MSKTLHIPTKSKRRNKDQSLRHFHGLTQKVTFKDKNKSAAQKRWITRQKNDPYVQLASQQGWRCRSAYKLLEIDAQFHLINKHTRAVDIGAAPGSWSQVLSEKGAANIVSIDLLPVMPQENIHFIQGDFRNHATQELVRQYCPSQPNLVLSDMAPNTTGHHRTDHLRILTLAEEALEFAIATLDEGGHFVTKFFQGGEEKDLFEQIKRHFRSWRLVKPQACRKESSEIYVVACHFLPSIKKKK